MSNAKATPGTSEKLPLIHVQDGESHRRKGVKGIAARMTEQIETDEAALIAAILAGDSRLFHDLIRPHERRVFMIALAMLKSEEDAEDAAQEAFLKAFRNLSRFRSESKFGTWLISIAINEARGRLRRQAIVRMESLDDTGEDGSGVSPALLRDWREIPSQALERKEIRAMLHEAVVNLPDIYRQVLFLRDMEELSIAETAETLSISASSVKVRLHRARILLQKHLSPLLKEAYPVGKRRWLRWS